MTAKWSGEKPIFIAKVGTNGSHDRSLMPAIASAFFAETLDVKKIQERIAEAEDLPFGKLAKQATRESEKQAREILSAGGNVVLDHFLNHQWRRAETIEAVSDGTEIFSLMVCLRTPFSEVVKRLRQHNFAVGSDSTPESRQRAEKAIAASKKMNRYVEWPKPPEVFVEVDGSRGNAGIINDIYDFLAEGPQAVK